MTEAMLFLQKTILLSYDPRPLYMSLIIAMLVGRIVNGFVNTFILSTQGYTLSVFMTASFITCLPGIIIQLIVIPILVRILNKTAA